ncbi:MAG TPA: TetR/AcrR family transcriptional regulator [Solirubrobacterales bacterium]|jgi:AcrR family transcriptional regulator|nr:TetR/AcrR family transcriptional regulator [Solirubrobacterales bacterium]
MLDAVGEEGYGQTSVRTVLDRTGLYRQAFYDHFTDKLDCFLQAYDEGMRRVEALTVGAAEVEASWRGRLRAGLAALLGFLDREPNVGRALLVEVHPAGPDALAKRDAAVARLADYLDLAREESDGSMPAPPIAPEAVAAGIHSVLHARLAAHRDGEFQRLLPEFMYIAVLPYFGPEEASAELRLSGR